MVNTEFLFVCVMEFAPRENCKQSLENVANLRRIMGLFVFVGQLANGDVDSLEFSPV